jgi:hypothetical protein
VRAGHIWFLRRLGFVGVFLFAGDVEMVCGLVRWFFLSCGGILFLVGLGRVGEREGEGETE